jgi:hypothetical protein
MKRTLVFAAAAALVTAAPALADDFSDGLAAIQNEWAAANYQTTDKAARGVHEQALAAPADRKRTLLTSSPYRISGVPYEDRT